MSRIWPVIGATVSHCVLLFGVWVATFPGEIVHERLPAVRVVPKLGKLSWSHTWPFDWSKFWTLRWSKDDDWTSLHELLFAGEVDEVSGQPRNPSSNRLVLTDQSFVDGEKLDKVEVTRSFRGRDLRGAVLNRADLRKADFTGAMLNGAKLDNAKLQNARFVCAPFIGARPPNWPDGCTWLQRASLVQAQLQGASLDEARLQGAELFGGYLNGASLAGARLQGASLRGAQLQGAMLHEAHLQGASLNAASLQAADLSNARLQGAMLHSVKLQGASLYETQMQGASLNGASLWRARGRTNFALTSPKYLDCELKPWESPSDYGKKLSYQEWLDNEHASV